MGLRGPQRNPNSRRGRAAADKAAKIASIEKRRTPAAPSREKSEPVPADSSSSSPTCPDWLSPDQAALFASLVTDLEAAQVPIKHIDVHAIMMAVQCLSGIKESTELFECKELDWDQRLTALKLKAQMGKDLMQWLQLICATPGSRARIGLKAEPPKKMGALAKILAAKQGRKP